MKKFLIIVTVLMVACSSTKNEKPEISKGDEQQELIRAYKKLIHRIWIDQPVYVEEVLSETEEFAALDSLIQKYGDWDDVFYFHDSNDSIAYYYNLRK